LFLFLFFGGGRKKKRKNPLYIVLALTGCCVSPRRLYLLAPSFKLAGPQQKVGPRGQIAAKKRRKRSTQGITGPDKTFPVEKGPLSSLGPENPEPKIPP